MKPLLILILACIGSGCAENGPRVEDVRAQFERGLSGQGHLVPLDHPDEPIPPQSDGAPAPTDL